MIDNLYTHVSDNADIRVPYNFSANDVLPVREHDRTYKKVAESDVPPPVII